MEKIDDNKLPVYEILVSDEDETGISLISFVDNPAIGVKGMAFSENEVIKLEHQFKETDDKMIVVGPALIPDKKIKRRNPDGSEYYVVFSKETIEKMVQKFNRYGSNRRINIDHSDKLVDAFVAEDWIVEDETYDKSRKYGFEVPVGTYMVKIKVEDEEFWNTEIKENGKYGFSIEGLLNQMLVSLNSITIYEDDDDKEYNSVDELIDDLTIAELFNIFEVFENQCTCGGAVEHEFAVEDLLKDFKRKQRPVLGGLSPEAKKNIADAAKGAAKIIKRGLVQSKPGIIHPNCACQFQFNDSFTSMEFRKSPPYIGKDGKPYPCALCDEAEQLWNSRGYVKNVFGERYTRIDRFPYYVKQS